MPHHPLIAPDGMFRVIGVDTFEHPTEGDYLIGDFESFDEARAAAEEKGGPMNVTYVYDDRGRMRFTAGSK